MASAFRVAQPPFSGGEKRRVWPCFGGFRGIRGRKPSGGAWV